MQTNTCHSARAGGGTLESGESVCPTAVRGTQSQKFNLIPPFLGASPLSYESFWNPPAEDREGGSKLLFGRTRDRGTSRTFCTSPEGQPVSARESKMLVEMKFSSAKGANPLQSDDAFEWVDISGFEVVGRGNCGFNQESALFIHQKTQAGGKPCFCSECGRSFRYPSALVTHRRSHTGEKPCPCTECGQAFSQKSNLVTHKRALGGGAFCVSGVWAGRQ